MKKIFYTLVSFLTLCSLITSAARAQTVSQPTISAITPSGGQTIYGNKIPVLIAFENFTLVDYQVNTISKNGEGHIHLWLDEQNPTGENAVKLTEETFTYNDVPYGDHTLIAELVNNNHKPLIPPQKVTVQFKNSPVVSPSPTVKSGIDKNTALVIFVVVALVIVAAWWYTKEEPEDVTEEKTETPAKTKRASKRKTTRKSKSKS